MAGRLRAFGAFVYDFVIGDDWLVAAGVAMALAATYGLSRASVAAWWLLPAALAVLLPVSLRRAIRRRQRPTARIPSHDHDAATAHDER